MHSDRAPAFGASSSEYRFRAVYVHCLPLWFTKARRVPLGQNRDTVSRQARGCEVEEHGGCHYHILTELVRIKGPLRAIAQPVSALYFFGVERRASLPFCRPRSEKTGSTDPQRSLDILFPLDWAMLAWLGHRGKSSRSNIRLPEQLHAAQRRGGHR